MRFPLFQDHLFSGLIIRLKQGWEVEGWGGVGGGGWSSEMMTVGLPSHAAVVGGLFAQVTEHLVSQLREFVASLKTHRRTNTISVKASHRTQSLSTECYWDINLILFPRTQNVHHRTLWWKYNAEQKFKKWEPMKKKTQGAPKIIMIINFTSKARLDT